MRFRLNLDKFDALAKLRGWRTLYSDVALATGFTRSYVRRVMLEEERLTDLFMLRYIQASGMNPEKPQEWGSLFIPDLRPDDQVEVLNYPKFREQVPYKALSVTAEFRRIDNPGVEVEEFGKTNSFQPTKSR